MGDIQEVCISRPEGAGGIIAFDEVTEVLGSLVIEGFVSGDQYFIVNPVFDWEPVEVVEDRGDVISFAGFGEEAGSGVLYIL